jgi:hypothetical protein
VRASYRSDLTAITLDENSNTSWIMALKAGVYSHPLFGEIAIDMDRASRFVANESSRVRGIQMDIDYDHKARRDDAAGWVVQTEARTDGVWYQVEWTEEAAQKIRAKQYKYFSAEFADEWTHPETGATYKDVLFGGGLTNRPFIKGMVPVNLSESEAEQARLAEETTPSTGSVGATEGGAVDLTAIRKALKLSEGTSDAAVLEAAVAKLAEVPTPAPEADDIKALAETNPLVAKMLAAQQESEKRLAEMEASVRLAEVRTALHEVDADTTIAITPATKELAQPLLTKLPHKERAELVAILRQFAEGKGTVQLGEGKAVGTSPDTKSADGDPVKKFTDLVSQIEKEDKLPYRQSLSVATQRDPRLFEAYHEATTAFKVVGS